MTTDIETRWIRTITVVFAFATIAVLVVVAIAGSAHPDNIGRLMRDVAIVADVHPTTGAVSSLGAFMWLATSAICAFAAAIVMQTGERRAALYLLSASGLSAFLWFDDFFMFHEWIARFKLGIPEVAVFAVLGLWTAVHLTVFRHIILRLNYRTLGLSLALLAGSVLFDTLLESGFPRTAHWRSFMEDGLKWLGIAGWTWFHVMASYRLVTSAVDRPLNPRIP